MYNNISEEDEERIKDITRKLPLWLDDCFLSQMRDKEFYINQKGKSFISVYQLGKFKEHRVSLTGRHYTIIFENASVQFEILNFNECEYISLFSTFYIYLKDETIEIRTR